MTARNPTVRKKNYSARLLKNAEKEFKYVMTIARHGPLKPDGKFYPQPHVSITARCVCMRAAGWKGVDFDTLMTVSGAGLLFTYQPDAMMPKYAHLWLGPDKRIAEATGFGWEWVKFNGADEAWQLIKETIDSGRPGHGHFWEDMLFVGYRDAARKEQRKLYVMGDPFPGPGVWWTWNQLEEWVVKFAQFGQNNIGRHTRKVRRAAEKKTALQVLKDAVAWSRTPPPAVRKSFPKASFGLAAIQAYADDVEAKPKAYFKETAWLGCHAINPQWAARNSTAAYLKRLAGRETFPKKVNKPLLAAANAYKAAYAAWRQFYQQLGHVAPKNAWNTKQRRLAGAAAIGEALEHEKFAVGEIKDALAVIGEGLRR